MNRCVTTAIIILLLVSTSTAATFPDETILALELSGELTAPPALETQIAQDLAAIRTAYPDVALINVRPSWAPDFLYVRLTDAARQDWADGVPTAFDSLNTVYGVTEITPYSVIAALGVQFGSPYHAEVLGDIYESLDIVVYASASRPVGDGSDVWSPGLPLYTVMEGSGDCPSGCTIEEYWEFSVTGGSVTLLDHHFSGGWSSVGDQADAGVATIGSVAPNPFNPATVVSYDMQRDGQVLLRIHDVRGRAVVDLVDGFRTAGEYEAVWRGVDRNGRPVPSGVYYCRLIAGGEVETVKVTLLK